MKSQVRIDYWQQQLDLWRASELSAPVFCKQHSLVYHQFIYWRQKLNHSATEPVVSAGFAAVVPMAVSAKRELTVTLPNGIAITGVHRHNIDLLGQVVKLL